MKPDLRKFGFINKFALRFSNSFGKFNRPATLSGRSVFLLSNKEWFEILWLLAYSTI